jgi:hypothetical protein
MMNDRATDRAISNQATSDEAGAGVEPGAEVKSVTRDEAEIEAGSVLATALVRLVSAQVLTPSQADAVRREYTTALHQPDADPHPRGDAPSPSGPGAAPAHLRTREDASGTRWPSLLMELGGYVGTAFIVAAAAALVGPTWDHFSLATRVSLLAGPALAMLAAAFVVASGTPGGWSMRPTDQPGPRRRLVSVLVLAAGGLFGGVAGLLSEGGQPERVVPLVLLAGWGLGYLLSRGVLLHLATAWALSWAVVALIEPSFDSEAALPGLVLAAVGAGWAALSVLRLIDERSLGIAVAGVTAFVGAEMVISSDIKGLGYVLLAAVAVAGLAGYIASRELSALAVGGVALAVVIPQAVIDYTDGSLGAAGALLISGLSVVAASTLGMRLRKAEDDATPQSSSA